MTDFSWLQYIGNPYSVMAVIATIMGFSFKNSLKKIEKPKPGFVLAMYGMFLVAILAIAAGGIAIVYLLSGESAKDEVVFTKINTTAYFEFFPTAQARDFVETGSPKDLTEKNNIAIWFKNIFEKESPVVTNPPKGFSQGWIWAGETISPKKDIPKNQPIVQMIQSKTFEFEQVPEKKEFVVTKSEAYLRKNPPQYSWWQFRYILGDLIQTVPPNTQVEVIQKVDAGKQLWLKVRLPKINFKK